MRDGGKGDKPRPIPNREQFERNFDAIFGSPTIKREGHCVRYDEASIVVDKKPKFETVYIERRVPEHLEEEAHRLIDDFLAQTGYNPDEI